MTDLVSPQTPSETPATGVTNEELGKYRLPNLFERFSKRYGIKDPRKVERMFQKHSTPNPAQLDQKHYANSIAVANVLPPRMFSSAITEAFSDPYGIGPSKKLDFTDYVILPPLPSPTTLHGHFAHPVAITAASGLTINQQKQYEVHHPQPPPAQPVTTHSGGRSKKDTSTRKKPVQSQRRGLERFSEMPRSVMWALTPKTRIVEVYGGGLPQRQKPVEDATPPVSVTEETAPPATSQKLPSIIPMIQLNDDELVHTGVSVNTLSDAGSSRTGTLESLAADSDVPKIVIDGVGTISRRVNPSSISMSRMSLARKSQMDLSMKRSTSMNFSATKSSEALNKPVHSSQILPQKQGEEKNLDKRTPSMHGSKESGLASQKVLSKNGSMLVLNPLQPKTKVLSSQNLSKTPTDRNRNLLSKMGNVGFLLASSKLGGRSATSINNLASAQPTTPQRTTKVSNHDVSKQRRKSVRQRVVYNPDLEHTGVNRKQKAEVDRIMERMQEKGVEIEREVLERALMTPEDVIKKAVSDEPVRYIRRRRKTRIFAKIPLFAAVAGGKTIRKHRASQESLIEDLSRTLLPGETVYDVLAIRRLLHHRRTRNSDNEPTEEELFERFCQVLVSEMEDTVEHDVVSDNLKQIVEEVQEEIAQEKARKEAEAAAKAEAERLEKERLERLAAEKATAEEAARKPDPIPVFVDKIIASLVNQAYPKPPTPVHERPATSQKEEGRELNAIENINDEEKTSMEEFSEEQTSVKHVRTASVSKDPPMMIADEFTNEINELFNLETPRSRQQSRKTATPKSRPISSRQRRVRAKTLAHWTEQEYKKLRKKYAKYHLDKAAGLLEPQPPSTPEWTDKFFMHDKVAESATGVKKRILPRIRSQSLPQPTSIHKDTYVPSTLLNLVERTERSIRDSSAREMESLRRQSHYTQTGDFEVYRLYNYHL